MQLQGVQKISKGGSKNICNKLKKELFATVNDIYLVFSYCGTSSSQDLRKASLDARLWIVCRSAKDWGNSSAKDWGNSSAKDWGNSSVKDWGNRYILPRLARTLLCVPYEQQGFAHHSFILWLTFKILFHKLMQAFMYSPSPILLHPLTTYPPSIMFYIISKHVEFWSNRIWEQIVFLEFFGLTCKWQIWPIW